MEAEVVSRLGIGAPSSMVADLAVDAIPVGRLTLTDDSLLLFLENRGARLGLETVDAIVAGANKKRVIFES